MRTRHPRRGSRCGRSPRPGAPWRRRPRRPSTTISRRVHCALSRRRSRHRVSRRGWRRSRPPHLRHSHRVSRRGRRRSRSPTSRCGVPGAVAAPRTADEATVGGGTSGEGPAAARADGGRPDGRQGVGGGCPPAGEKMERWSGGAAAVERWWRWALEAATAAGGEQAGGGAWRASGWGRNRAGLDAAGGARVPWRWASEKQIDRWASHDACGCLHFFAR
jgi:hypothetical protein